MSTMPKGAEWKTSVVSRVSMISVLSMMSEGILDEMIGRG